LYNVRGFNYIRCVTCGSARLDPLPTDPTSIYDESYFANSDLGGYTNYEADHELHERNANSRLALIARMAPPQPMRLVDVGCATGYTLTQAKRKQWKASGVEVSDFARGIAADRGHTVFSSIGPALEAVRPNVVTFFQVLEHMARPDVAVRAASEATERGTVLAIETWDRRSAIARLLGTRWHQANPPSVIHLFTREGVSQLLTRNGFEPTLIRATAKFVSFSQLAGVAEQRWGPLARAFRRILGANRLRGGAFSYNLGDLITAIAVKS